MRRVIALLVGILFGFASTLAIFAGAPLLRVGPEAGTDRLATPASHDEDPVPEAGGSATDGTLSQEASGALSSPGPRRSGGSLEITDRDTADEPALGPLPRSGEEGDTPPATEAELEPDPTAGAGSRPEPTPTTAPSQISEGQATGVQAPLDPKSELGGPTPRTGSAAPAGGPSDADPPPERVPSVCLPTSPDSRTGTGGSIEPLTGRPSGDPTGAAAERPTVAVKIDNSASARPQAGLNEADVLYEIMVEAGYSRFLALFHSVDDTLIGPVRSGRESDLDILRTLGQPLFVMSGANGYTLGLIGDCDGDDWVLADKGAQFRDPGRHGQPWQNVMVTSNGVRLADPGEGGAPTPIFAYSDRTLRGGEVSAGMEVGFGRSRTSYEWDGATYLRSSDGEPHLDSNGGRVSADNVVVQFVDYEFRAATGSPVARTVGRGAVWMLRDGRLVEGRWRRDSASGATVYTDAAGDTVELRPGRTHVLLAPPGSARRT